MKFIHFFIIILSLRTFANETNTITSALSIFPFYKNSSKTIKTSGCKIQDSKWLSLLLTQEPFVEEIKYSKECDIEGRFKVLFNKPFPIKLNFRDKNTKNLQANMFINIEFRDKPYLILKLINAKLVTIKETLSFYYEHEFQIDPFSDPPIKEDRGGKITFIKDGKKISKKIAPNK